MKKAVVVLILILLLPVILYLAFPGLLYESVVILGRKSVGVAEKSVEAADHTISYIEGGKGESILLVHGFSAEKDQWLRFARYFIPTYHVVAVDLPGFGQSSKKESVRYTIAAQVSMLNEFVNKVGLERFHIVGNSMGGSISGKYAVDYPDKIISLALFNTGGIPSAEKSEFAKLLEKGENPLLINTTEDFDSMMSFVSFERPSIPSFIKGYLVSQAISNRPFNEKILNDLVEERYSLEAELSKIGNKTLILWGDTDRLIHVSATKILAQGLADSTTVIMKNCGHCPMAERPEETAAFYLKFLEQQDVAHSTASD